MPTFEQPTPLYLADEQSYADSVWTTRLELPFPESKDEQLERLAALAGFAGNPQRPLSGYFETSVSEDRDVRQAIILARDPSRRFGTPSPELCDELADHLATLFGWSRHRRTLPPGSFRIIAGTQIGYNADARRFSLDEVRALLPANSDITVTGGDLFSVRWRPEVERRKYSEPAAILQGPVGALAMVQEVAYVMGQERFVAEVRPEPTKAVTAVFNLNKAA